ncbi:MAG: S1C family serine protease [Patescibacteria group bacterium]
MFIVGGFGSVVFNAYILPKASSSPTLSKLKLFKKAIENTTIISKTEQVTIKEEDSVNKIASQAGASVVNIISISDKDKTALNPLGGIRNGTGVIITSDGLIATYRTAITESDARYQILPFNGSSHEAKLVGIDEFTNLAFLKIEAGNFSPIPFSNSDDFYPGKKLIAIGNSFEDYQNRYSSGLLSNIDKTFNISGKTLSSSEKMEGVFETDFLDKKDYLGGPIINYNGELVGIIGSLTTDNQEKFFEIPSNIVKNSMNLATGNEFSKRPYLGIYYLPISKAYAIANNLNRDKGALIYSSSGKQGLAILSGSPAEKAGLKINDIIISVGDKEVNLDNPLSNLLSQYKKGDSIELTVIRDGQEMKVKVQL